MLRQPPPTRSKPPPSRKTHLQPRPQHRLLPKLKTELKNTAVHHFSSTPRRNQPRNAKTQPSAFSTPSSSNKDYVGELKTQLSHINAQPHQLPKNPTHESEVETIDVHPDTPLTADQISQIFGRKAKLSIPEIPLNGTQAYWATVNDPNNPFTFPVLNLETLLAPTDISVSIQPKDSDVSADKLVSDYKAMMASTIHQGGSQPRSEDHTQQFEHSLHNIANPTSNGPFQQAAAMPKLGAGDRDIAMSTSRIHFGQTVVIMTPVRKSQLEGVKKVFKVITQEERQVQSVRDIVAQNEDARSNPISNMLVLAKADQSNKRFDVLLTRARRNKSTMDLASLMSGGNDSQQSLGEESRSALIFSSNVSQQSLSTTKQRLDAQNAEYSKRLAQQNKVYNAPFQEHVCLERNYIFELDRDPSLVTFPYSHKDPHKPDPITHLLAFPLVSSTITYSTIDPLGDPSSDLHYRLAEAEFLIQCCLMGQNFPAPIDPKFAPLMDQDESLELTPEESQQTREVIGRSVIAMYGHGSGLASKPWSLQRSLVKEAMVKQVIATPTNPKDVLVNYEFEIAYTHNQFYRTLYNFSLLPTENEIQANLSQLHSQLKSMSAFDEEMLSTIRSQTMDAFGEQPLSSDQLANALASGTVSDHIKTTVGQHLDFSTMAPEEIESFLEERMRDIDQRQYLFQQQLEEKIRMETVQRLRSAQGGQRGDELGTESEDYEPHNSQQAQHEGQDDGVVEAELVSKETIISPGSSGEK